MMNQNARIDEAFSNARIWKHEADALRTVLLASKLTEQFKWGKPCYSHQGKNICIMQRMNDFLALLFFKGALLKDSHDVLEVQGPNSHSGYRMRFTSVDDVERLSKSVRACICEAIEVEKAGLKIEKIKDIEYPEELINKLDEDQKLREAFSLLTPGRRRGYALYFSEAKQSSTRTARIEKHHAKILQGKGIHDR